VLTVPAFIAMREALAFAGTAQFPTRRAASSRVGLTGTIRLIDQGTLSLPLPELPGIASASP